MKLKKVPGVPILRIHYNALVLEKPDFHSKKEADMIGASKSMTDAERQRIKDMKKLHSIVEKKEREPQEKRVKGVNPLAMKKKKKKKTDVVVGKRTKDSAKTRTRKRKKIAAHVLEHIQ